MSHENTPGLPCHRFPALLHFIETIQRAVHTDMRRMQ